ncbi:MAG TPA: LysR family transcriptional regulator [Caulobacter sp.]|nr:LysR family transcriptional regulator [Caulobacter sp.]
MDWDDLRFVLAVTRSGAALGAARALGVNQSTVIRRIAHIEAALGVSLFERLRQGYRPTEAGLRVAETAERVEAEVLALTGRMAAERRTVAGTVRLTCSDTVASRLVVPWLPDFHKTHPGVVIEIITSDTRLDLARGEAEIALRAGSSPEGAGVVARRMPYSGWNLYCSRGYAEAHGAPASPEEIAGHPVIGMEGQMAALQPVAWLAAQAEPGSIRFRSNSLTGLIANLRADMGLAMLPCVMGDGEPDLVRCLPPLPELDSEVWLIVREDLKAAPHVRAFADFLAERMHQNRALMTGRPG